ncbi:hypothetical protein [Thermus sp.]|uniref:hypothetical protein n=1 Tax=Thermus sp. TaxID=275 RepID=UPI003D0BA865
MRELAFPAGVRWRLWWALLLGLLLLAFGFKAREPLALLVGGLLVLAFALHLRRTAYALTLELEGVRYGGRLYPKEALEGVALDPLWGRLLLDFGGERLPLPLGLPGWDEVLAQLGVDWREVEDLVDYLLSQRGRVWFLGVLHPPREAEGVHLWAQGLYRRHFLKIYGALALLGVGLALFSLAEGLGLALFALGFGLALWWLLVFPHDLVRLRGGGGRYNPLDPEFQKLAEEGSA